MNRRRLSLAVHVAGIAFALTVFMLRVSWASEVSFFVNVDGIKGESTDKDHKDQIDALAVGQGVSQPPCPPEGCAIVAQKVSFTDISIVKRVDKSTPELLLAVANGKHIKSVTIDFVRRGPSTVLTMMLEKVLVTSVRTTADVDGMKEFVTLRFGKVKLEYQQFDVDGRPVGGKVTFAWDVEGNVKP